MVYQPGDDVVIPNCGVGKVKRQVSLPTEEQDVQALEIILHNTTGRVWIPVAQVEAQGVRPVMARGRFSALLKIIRDTDAPKRRKHWNQRRKRYSDLFADGRPTTMAALIGELASVKAKNNNGLSFSEKKIFRRAKELLATEVAIAKGVPRKEITTALQKATAEQATSA